MAANITDICLEVAEGPWEAADGSSSTCVFH